MRGSAVLLGWGGTGGIRAFKFWGPKNSATRRENARKQKALVNNNHAVLKGVESKRDTAKDVKLEKN